MQLCALYLGEPSNLDYQRYAVETLGHYLRDKLLDPTNGYLLDYEADQTEPFRLFEEIFSLQKAHSLHVCTSHIICRLSLIIWHFISKSSVRFREKWRKVLSTPSVF